MGKDIIIEFKKIGTVPKDEPNPFKRAGQKYVDLVLKIPATKCEQKFRFFVPDTLNIDLGRYFPAYAKTVASLRACAKEIKRQLG